MVEVEQSGIDAAIQLVANYQLLRSDMDDLLNENKRLRTDYASLQADLSKVVQERDVLSHEMTAIRSVLASENTGISGIVQRDGRWERSEVHLSSRILS